jgi:hypothetical protein
MSSYKIIIELPASQRHLDGWDYWLKPLLYSPACIAVLLPDVEATNFSQEFVPPEKIIAPGSLEKVEADWKLSFRCPDEQSKEFSSYQAGLIGYLAFDCDAHELERNFKFFKSQEALIITDFLLAEIDFTSLVDSFDYLENNGLYIPFQFSFEDESAPNGTTEKASPITIFYDSSFLEKNRKNALLRSRTKTFYKALDQADRISTVNLNEINLDRLPTIVRNSDHLIVHDVKPRDFDAILSSFLPHNKKLTINCRELSFILRLLQKGAEPHDLVSNKRLLNNSIRNEALNIISEQEKGNTPTFNPQLSELFGTNFSLTDLDNLISRKPKLGSLSLQPAKQNLEAIFKLVLDAKEEDKNILNSAAKSFLHDYLKSAPTEELYEFSKHEGVKDLILNAFSEFEFPKSPSFSPTKSLLDAYIDFLGFNGEYKRFEQFVKQSQTYGPKLHSPFFKFTHSLFSRHDLYPKFFNRDYVSQNRETLDKAIDYWQLSLSPQWSDAFSEKTCILKAAVYLALTQRGNEVVELMNKLEGSMHAVYHSTICLLLLLGKNRELALKQFQKISHVDITTKGVRPIPHTIFLHACTATLLNEEKTLGELLPILKGHQDFFTQNQEDEGFHYPLLISLVLKQLGSNELSLKYLDLSLSEESHAHYAQDWWDRIDLTDSSISLTKIDPLLSLVSL